ncbi:hypothetical protein LL033_04810 [Clostridium estertheticum]|uniref:hypothetical protein n=1 Tax=Clostridium estertheticum TaxID=238834 RepID=UPI001C0C7037|nr:hypothetical protein [Clostridium estertheticum]MBU3214588.1 hypothetical protein [Clostridium estertheticum]WAG56569.1 hypothetical protein LL033_04810 [Clostridium estertheticum]
METKSDTTCLTWHEILIKKGINPEISKSLIGFTSWNQKEIPNKLGKHITDILQENIGKVIVKDVIGTRYNDIGLLFLNNDMSEDIATMVFNTIMEYEQEEVYDIL